MGCTTIAAISIFLIGLVSGQNEMNQAGQHFADGFKSIGDYFVRQYKKVEDFFASTKDELEKKVKDTADFLGQLKTHMNDLVKDAQQRSDQALQDALGRVNTFYNDVNDFQNRMKQATQAQMQQLEEEWKNKVQSMYNGGLDKIIQAADAAKSGSQGIRMNTFLMSSALFAFVIILLLQ